MTKKFYTSSYVNFSTIYKYIQFTTLFLKIKKLLRFRYKTEAPGIFTPCLKRTDNLIKSQNNRTTLFILHVHATADPDKRLG